MDIIIDRFEEDYVILEFDRKLFNIPKVFLPQNAKEGDCIHIKITVDEEKTRKKRIEMEKLMNDIWKD